MMPGIRRWMLGVVLTAFAGGLARQLTPKGREQAPVRLVCGLLLTLAVLQPLASVEWTASVFHPEDLRQQAADQADVYRAGQQDALARVIAAKTEAYICDKADRLGLQCSVTVTTAAGESGIPLPDTVTVRGGYSAALASCIEEEVGVPPEKQFWLEDITWTMTSESSPLRS